MAVRDRLGLSHEQQLEFLFTAGAFGLVIANNASISGAEGVVKRSWFCKCNGGGSFGLRKNGTPHQAAQAVAITLKNMMGLICDPVAGLVEVPCVKRNALGVFSSFHLC